MQDSMRRMRGLTATYLWEDALVVPTLTSEERKQIRDRVDKWADMLPEEVPGFNARQRTYYRLFQENDLRAARIWYELWFNQNNWWCHLKKAVKKSSAAFGAECSRGHFLMKKSMSLNAVMNALKTLMGVIFPRSSPFPMPRTSCRSRTLAKSTLQTRCAAIFCCLRGWASRPMRCGRAPSM